MQADKSPLNEQDREKLVAFLDGELDEESAQQVEGKLNADAGYRAEADQLKRAWDLLDYLPRPEPSPNFTHRTMERISEFRPTTGKPGLTRTLLRWAAILLLVFGLGFLLVFVLSRIVPAREKNVAMQASDMRMLNNLPSYLWIEDVDQLTYLDHPDLFGDDIPILSTVSTEPVVLDKSDNIDLHPEQLDSLGDNETRDRLKCRLAVFRNLSAEKQAKYRRLDREMNVEDPVVQSQRRRILDRYVLWLKALPDDEKEQFQKADRTSWKPLVLERRNREWVQRQSPRVSESLRDLNAEERTAEIARLRKEDRQFRLLWTKHVDDEDHRRRDALIKEFEDIARERKQRRPWPKKPTLPPHLRSPLTLLELPEEVRNYIHHTLKPLLLPEEDEVRFTFYSDLGGTEFIHELLDLTYRYAPGSTSAQRPSHFRDLPAELKKGKASGSGKEDELTRTIREAEGQWPDFGVAVVNALRQLHPKGSGKLEMAIRWGYGKHSDFDPTIQSFLAKELTPTLTADEKRQLDEAEGKWPVYHQTMLDLAHKKGMQVPGMDLPGAREFWTRLEKSLPEEPDRVLLEFAASLDGRELAAINFSLRDPIQRERVKEAYYRKHPDRLQKRLLEDYQYYQKKANSR